MVGSRSPDRALETDPVFTWVYVDGDADDELVAVETANEGEPRALSVVTRTVHRGVDSCLLCRNNTDPKAVPLHPHCTCNITTDDVQLGQLPRDNRNFQVISTADEEIVFLSESDLPAAIVLDPATTGAIAIEELRYGDLARWLEQVGPTLSGADQLISIISEFDENEEDLADVSESIVEGAEDIVENRRVWFGIAKVVGL